MCGLSKWSSNRVVLMNKVTIFISDEYMMEMPYLYENEPSNYRLARMCFNKLIDSGCLVPDELEGPLLWNAYKITGRLPVDEGTYLVLEEGAYEPN